MCMLCILIFPSCKYSNTYIYHIQIYLCLYNQNLQEMDKYFQNSKFLSKEVLCSMTEYSVELYVY